MTRMASITVDGRAIGNIDVTIYEGGIAIPPPGSIAVPMPQPEEKQPTFRHGIGPGSHASRVEKGPTFRHGVHPRFEKHDYPTFRPGIHAIPRHAPEEHATNRDARIAVGKGAMMDEFIKQGMSEKQAERAANLLAGQAIAESGMDPTLEHDRGTGHGIYGARLGRRDRMFKWLDEHGYDHNSLEGQARYMAIEAMSGEYPATKRALQSGDPSGMGTVTREFEAPRVPNSRMTEYGEAARVPPHRPSLRATPSAPSSGEPPEPYDRDRGGAAPEEPSIRQPPTPHGDVAPEVRDPASRSDSDVKPEFPAAPGVNVSRLSPEMIARVNAAYHAAVEAGKPFTVISGYRPATRAEARELGMSEHSSQEDIWERSKGGKLFAAAPPGRSRHQRGEAIDVEGPGKEWLIQHREEFGLEPANRKLGTGFDPGHSQLDHGYSGGSFADKARQQQQTVGKQSMRDVSYRSGSSAERFGVEAADVKWANQTDPAQLATLRAKFGGELNDPLALNMLFASTMAEVGDQGAKAQQAYMESVFNRALSRNQTLARTINDPKYYPATTMTKLGARIGGSDAARLQAITSQVLGGSNISRMATGNASGTVGFGGQPALSGNDIGYADK